MPLTAKIRRVDEDEIRRRWAALTLEQRQAVTRFDDAALINCIRDAVQALYMQQCHMMRLGTRGTDMAAPDMFVDSELLKTVFDLQWNITKSDTLQGAFLMDPDDQPPLMTLRAQAIEGNKIFECLRGTLPDLLGAQTGRFPIHRARWKQLWNVVPSSVVSLEQQLAKLVEQALWTMGSSPAFEVKPDSCADLNSSTAIGDVPLEDWMEESAKSESKSKKKKKKNKQTSNSEMVASLSQQPSRPEHADAVDQRPASEEDVAQVIQTDDTDVPTEQTAGQTTAWKVKQQVLDQRAPSSDPIISEIDFGGVDYQDDTRNDVSDVPDEVHMETVPPRRESVQTDRAVLNQHFWKTKTKPTLRWCLPSLPSMPWSRGHWVPAENGDSPSGSGMNVVVRNTFVEIDETDGPPLAAMRLSRSLSPSSRSFDTESGADVFSLSTNRWRR